VIVITAASGQLGRLVVKALLRSLPPSQIVAAARSPEKAKDLAAAGVEVRAADYDRPESLDAAFRGAEKLLLISGTAIGRRVAQHGAVIDSARKAGVRLIAYTSVLRAPTSPLAVAPEHRETEALIKSSGLAHALLRNGWYSENYLGRAASAVASGTLVGSAGEGRICAAPRADYADAAAAALTAKDTASRIYELAGDEAFTLPGLAAVLSRHVGRTIAYQNVSETDFAASLEAAGIPAMYATMIAKSDVAAASGALYEGERQLSRLIGRPTTAIDAVIAEAVRDGRIKR